MAEKVFIPEEYPKLVGPLIYLAGPVTGAPPWHEEAVRIIHQLNPSIHIAIPNKQAFGKVFDYKTQDWKAHHDWETHYLQEAANHGVILFWMAKEVHHQCDRSYAQGSRFELGEWKVRHERDGSKIVLEIEPGFPGERLLKQRFSEDCADTPICSSLKETCQKAVELIGK